MLSWYSALDHHATDLSAFVLPHVSLVVEVQEVVEHVVAPTRVVTVQSVTPKLRPVKVILWPAVLGPFFGEPLTTGASYEILPPEPKPDINMSGTPRA